MWGATLTPYSAHSCCSMPLVAAKSLMSLMRAVPSIVVCTHSEKSRQFCT